MINLIVIVFYRKLIRNEIIRADLFRYFGRVDLISFKKALRIPGFEFTLYFRLAGNQSKFSLLGILSRIAYKKLFYKYGLQIPRATKIGKGLRISHFGGLVVNHDAVIGEHCYLSHNVTLGQISYGPKKGSPIIGNRSWIGPGALVVGHVVIGDDVLIAGNAFVNFDVPANSIVIGNPGKIIYSDKATEGYVTNVYC